MISHRLLHLNQHRKANGAKWTAAAVPQQPLTPQRELAPLYCQFYSKLNHQILVHVYSYCVWHTKINIILP